MSNWKGTTVPNSGTVEKVYFNTNLSVDEVVSIIESANLTSSDDGEFVYQVLITNDFSKTIVIDTGSGAGLYIYDSISLFTYFASNANENYGNFVGWNPQLINPLPINGEVMYDMEGMIFGVDNAKVSSIFSITPFEEIVEIKKKRKNILMHPTKEDGTLDTNTDLYPQTTVNNLLTRKGEKYKMPNVVFEESFYETNEDGTPNFDKPIKDKNSVSLKKEPRVIDEYEYYKEQIKYCPDGITVEVLGGNRYYYTPGNIFFNTYLSKPEVTKILDSLNLRTNENPSDKYYIYYCDNSRNFVVQKYENGTYEIKQCSSNSVYVVWNSLEGYSKEFKNREQTFIKLSDFNVTYEVGQIGECFASIYNDKLNELISTIPYEKVEQNIEPIFTPIPNSGNINNIYINPKLNPINVIRDIISHLSFENLGNNSNYISSSTKDDKTYIIFSDKQAKNSLVLYKTAYSNYYEFIPPYMLCLRKEEEGQVSQYSTILWELLKKPEDYTNKTKEFVEALSNLNIELCSEVELGTEKYKVGQSNEILSLLSITPFKYRRVEMPVPKAVSNTNFVDKIYINNNLSPYETIELLKNIYYKETYQYNSDGSTEQIFVYFIVSSKDLSKQIKAIYKNGIFEILFSTPENEIKLFAFNEEQIDEFEGWNKEITEVEIGSEVLYYFEDKKYVANFYAGSQNERLKEIFSSEPYTSKKEEYVEKESIQLYSNDKEPKKVFPRIRVEDLRTANDDKYNVSNITYGENKIIGPKIEYYKGEFNTNNLQNYTLNKLYFNVSLENSEVIKLLKNIDFEWGNDSSDDFNADEYGSDGEAGVTTIIDFYIEEYSESLSKYIYKGTKIKVKKILGEYFIEKQIYERDNNDNKYKDEIIVMFSSNSAYGGFSGWNKNEFNDLDIKDKNWNQYYSDEETINSLSEILSYTPFEVSTRNGVVFIEKSIYQKDSMGNPDFNKPVSLNFDISNRNIISGNLKNKIIKINDSLPAERIKQILSNFWRHLTIENRYYYICQYSGTASGNLWIDTTSNNNLLRVLGSNSKHNSFICIELDRHNVLTINKSEIEKFNQVNDLLNETSNYFSCYTGEFNDELKELFYMESDDNFLVLNLDNTAPLENSKPVSHIICNGKSHPIVDADAIVYEEVD